MLILISLAFWVLWVVLCFNMAGNRNRHQVGWAVGGLCFGVFAVLVLLTLKPIAPPTGHWLTPPTKPTNT